MRIGNKIFSLPIIIGAYDKADKCSLWQKTNGGYSLLICRLKEPLERGSIPTKDDIKNDIVNIHFCKLSALKVFAEGVNAMVRAWEEEGETECSK